jgi:hypothetical protein
MTPKYHYTVQQLAWLILVLGCAKVRINCKLFFIPGRPLQLQGILLHLRRHQLLCRSWGLSRPAYGSQHAQFLRHGQAYRNESYGPQNQVKTTNFFGKILLILCVFRIYTTQSSQMTQIYNMTFFQCFSIPLNTVLFLKILFQEY